MHKLRWVALLACASLLAALVAAFAPLEVESSEITWKPAAGDAASTPLQLSALVPESMVLQIPCDKVRAANSSATAEVQLAWTRFNDLGPSGIGLAAQGNQVWAVDGRAALPNTVVTMPTGACNIVTTFTRDSTSVKVQAVQNNAVIAESDQQLDRAGNLEQPAGTVSALGANPAVVPGISVAITTQPTSVQTPAWRWLVSLVAIVLSLLAVWALAKVPRPLTEPAADGSEAEADGDVDGPIARPRKWTASDTFLAAVLAVLVTVIPPNYDDGWVLATVRQFKEIGFFSNFYWIEAAPQPQGFWWAFLERFWLTPLDTPAFLLRLPAALLILWAWWFLRRRVIDQRTAGSRSVHAAGVAIFALGAGAFLITLRPEPMVALLLVVQLGLLTRLYRRPDPWLFAAMGLIIALAMSLHQTGWVVVAASVAAIPGWLGWHRRVPRRTALIGTAATCGTTIAVFLTLITLGGNFWFWLRGYEAFASEPTYGEALNESGRLQLLLDSGFSGAGQTMFTVLAIALVLISAAVTLVRTPTDYVQWACIAAPFGLVLTSSKLQTHVGVIVPAIAVLAATMVARLRNSERSSQVAAVALGISLALGSWIAIRPLGVALLVILIVAVVMMRAMRNRDDYQRAGAVSIGLVTAVVGVLVVSPLVASASTPASWVNQQVQAIQGNGCGIAGNSGLKVPTSVSSLQFAGVPGNVASVPLDIAVTTPKTVPQAGPIAGLAVFTVKFGYSGIATTPWYTVGDAKEVSLWTRGFSAAGGHVLLTFESSAGQVSEVPLSGSGTDWKVLVGNVPADSQRMRIGWFTSSGPSSVTAPAVPTAESNLLEAAGQRDVWVAPDRYLEASCLELPSIATGVVPPFNWSIGAPTWVAALRSDWQVQMACPSGDFGSSRCAVRIYRPSQPGYSIRTITQSL